VCSVRIAQQTVTFALHNISSLVLYNRSGHHGEETTTMVWPRQKDARGENMKINYGMDTMGEKEEGTSTKERGWMEYKQPRQET
jgi:hypothetical protein